ncbi:anacyclamide/piricyclamide family prenylated cyclic peptide [Floridanema evergladense]|uniref:Anacyclamide/piricyclamide family prenylated cyclic peptide n=1 Tax=Floridaenema evergladense BLCC-F167 TaxID=3153639 RepID=A0ABV4WG27_9CYAN
MKKKNLMPLLASPVSRNTKISDSQLRSEQGLVIQTYCDIETRQCFPFAGDDAE